MFHSSLVAARPNAIVPFQALSGPSIPLILPTPNCQADVYITANHLLILSSFSALNLYGKGSLRVVLHKQGRISRQIKGQKHRVIVTVVVFNCNGHDGGDLEQRFRCPGTALETHLLQWQYCFKLYYN